MYFTEKKQWQQKLWLSDHWKPRNFVSDMCVSVKLEQFCVISQLENVNGKYFTLKFFFFFLNMIRLSVDVYKCKFFATAQDCNTKQIIQNSILFVSDDIQ